jgi:hypothetical protein
MVARRLFFPWSLRLIPVVGGVIGWRFGGWLGAVAGAIVGCIAAVVIWVAVVYVVVSMRLARWRRTVAKRQTESYSEITAKLAAVDDPN